MTARKAKKAKTKPRKKIQKRRVKANPRVEVVESSAASPKRTKPWGRFEVKVVRPLFLSQKVEISDAETGRPIWEGVMGYGIIEELCGRASAYFMARWKTDDVLVLDEETRLDRPAYG